MEEKIRKCLEEIRGNLQADGGDLEIVEIKGMEVKLKLVGACGCCPHAMSTLKEGIERHLKENVDESITVTKA
jgi:Fe-S cluster biogenesis protein NfuA